MRRLLWLVTPLLRLLLLLKRLRRIGVGRRLVSPRGLLRHVLLGRESLGREGRRLLTEGLASRAAHLRSDGLRVATMQWHLGSWSLIHLFNRKERRIVPAPVVTPTLLLGCRVHRRNRTQDDKTGRDVEPLLTSGGEAGSASCRTTLQPQPSSPVLE